MRVRAYVGFGGNLGRPEDYLRPALRAVARLPESRVTGVSSLYRTAPVGGIDQPDFANGALELETGLAAEELLEALLGIEKALGRSRELRWGPRTVDLDLLLWGRSVVHSERLELPHPRLHERAFVLVPLAEIAPGANHPVLGKTVGELLGALGSVRGVERLGEPSPAEWLSAAEEES